MSGTLVLVATPIGNLGDLSNLGDLGDLGDATRTLYSGSPRQ